MNTCIYVVSTPTHIDNINRHMTASTNIAVRAKQHIELCCGCCNWHTSRTRIGLRFWFVAKIAPRNAQKLLHHADNYNHQRVA